MQLTKNEKQIWNDAVKKTLKEVVKFDGIITSDKLREYLYNTVLESVSFKIKPVLKNMKKLQLILISILLAGASFSQCTVATATTTGLTITNKTTYIEAYKLKFGNNETTTAPVAAGQSNTIMLAWCDTLFITPAVSMACGCGVPSSIILVNHNCGVLASPFQWYLERHGDWVTFTLLPVNVGQIKAAYPQEKVNGVFVNLDTIAGTELHEGVLYHRTVKIK